jgi:hypothetical protein
MINQFLKFKLMANSKNPSSEWKKENRNKSFKIYNNINLEKYNLGIPTGKINNILVVDLDIYKSCNEFIKIFGDNYINKFNTFTVQTPNKGIHLYFQYDKTIKQTQNAKHNIDIRNDGGYIVSPGSRINNNYYEIINDKSIKKISIELKNWILDNLYIKKKIKNKLINLNNNNNISINFLKNILDDDKINEIINKLNSKYWSGYQYFLIFTSFMKSLNKFNLWDNINKTKQKYNYDNNLKIWRNCKIGDGFILSVLKDYDPEILNYYFYKPLIKNVIKPDKIINRNKLGFNVLKKNINYLIKSDTGTGKTTTFKKYILDNKKFISLVSRISLGEEQYNTFTKEGINCKFYNFENYFNNGDNVIITIDSILRLRNINFKNYVIFLDEFNSLIEYLITSTTLNNRRTAIYNMLFKIINECQQFIAVDADINDISIQLLKYTNKEFYYIKNNFKHNKGIKAFEIFEIDVFLNELKKDNKFLVCCDSKKNAEMIYNELKDDKIKLITSITDEYINFDEYDKIIYSPKIIYGIDSSMKRNVYCFYKEHTISPRAMVQQLSRCRNIDKLKFLFLKKKLTYNSLTIQDIEQEIIEQDKYATYEFELNCPDIINKQYLNLLKRFEYNNNCCDTNKYVYFKLLLIKRGFIIKTNNNKTNKKELKKLINDLNQVNEENFNINHPQVIKINKILKIPEEEIENYKEYFLNDNLLKYHFKLCNYLNNNIDDLNNKLLNNEDFNSKKTISKFMKIRYLKQLHKKLNSEDNNIFDKEYNLTQDDREKLFNNYNIIFRNRNKNKNFNNDNDFKYYISKIYKNLFGSEVLNSKRIKKDNIRKFKYSINQDYLNKNIDLYNFRKIDYEEYMF